MTIHLHIEKGPRSVGTVPEPNQVASFLKDGLYKGFPIESQCVPHRFCGQRNTNRWLRFKSRSVYADNGNRGAMKADPNCPTCKGEGSYERCVYRDGDRIARIVVLCSCIRKIAPTESVSTGNREDRAQGQVRQEHVEVKTY